MSFAPKDVFSKQEMLALTRRSDLMGAWGIAKTWSLIAATFALLAIFPHPVMFVLAVVLLGGQQLCLAVLTHEASHRTLFRTRWLNETLADWLCGRPIWADVARYRTHHMQHHAHTGTELDPDMSLIEPFPTGRGALLRKLLRDVVGISGLRRIVGLVLMDIGVLKYTVAAEVTRLPRNGRHWMDYLRSGIRNMGPVLLANTALAGVLVLAGQGWLYLAWALAYLTSFSLFLRIRSMAEHACTERTSDQLRNTRTTYAGLLARLTVAPMNVNYHLEHHLMASVPYYRLPAMHKLLLERVDTSQLTLSPGYRDVLRTAASAGGSA